MFDRDNIYAENLFQLFYLKYILKITYNIQHMKKYKL